MSSTSRISANVCQQTFLLKEDSVAGPLRFVEGEDGKRLQKISRQISAEQTPDAKKYLAYTTGLGLSLRGIPLRLPALIVPTLKVMKRMHEIGVHPPDYLIYQATDFIAETNAMDVDRARGVSTLMHRYLEKYVQVLHPELTEHVQFSFGNEAAISSQKIDSIVSLIREKMNQGGKFTALMEKFSFYREQNGHPKGSEFSYAAANALCNGAVEELYPFQEKIGYAPHIVPIGGQREHPFFQVSKALNGEKGQIIPMLQRAGEMPTYYPYRGGDFIADETSSEVNVQQLPTAIRYDYQVLESDGAHPSMLRDIFKSAL